MSMSWKKKCLKKGIFIHANRRTWVNHQGIKWAILGDPLRKPIQKDDFAVTCQTKKIHDKKYKVLFEAHANNFKVYKQYLKTRKLTKKYAHHKFSNIRYSSDF